jgi:uncharacterized protein
MDHVEKLRNAYEQWDGTKAGSVETWAELLADDIVWHSMAGVLPGIELDRPLRGKPEVARYFAELGQSWEMVHYTVERFIAQGDHVAMRGSCAWKSRKTGQVVETHKADFFRFRDGKVVEFWEFYDTAKTIAGHGADA